jgi:ERCC4-type nuclease
VSSPNHSLIDMWRAVCRLGQPLATTDFFKRRFLLKRLSGNRSSVVQRVEFGTDGPTVQIDSRESALRALSTDSSITFPQLTEGDVIIAHGNRRIIIERKTVSDFYNSLKTRRLSDQISRVFDRIAKDGIQSIFVIVLEGSLEGVSPVISSPIRSAYFNLALRDKVMVVRTDSTSDTYETINCFRRNFSKYFASPKQFSDIVHVERSGRKIAGLHMPYLKLLMSIHGVSPNRAKAIAAKFPSIEQLVKYIRTGGGVNVAGLSQLVCSSNSRSVGSPLGLATATNIAEALIGPDDPIVAQFKLHKSLISENISKRDAMMVAESFITLSNLRLSFLTDPDNPSIPPSVKLYLESHLTDPSTLLCGLKSVRGISSKTAGHLTQTFSSIKQVHAVLSTGDPRITIRMAGTDPSAKKRLIARSAVENILRWLHKEGYFELSSV